MSFLNIGRIYVIDLESCDVYHHHKRRHFRGLYSVAHASFECPINVCGYLNREFYSSDDVSRLLGSSEKHDLPLRSRSVPDVWRPDDRVSDL